MQNSAKIIGMICIAFLAISCSKDDDPVDNNLFVGTYDGSVSFTEGDTHIESENSSVTVVKVGDNYNFKFNEDGIPSLTGVEFRDDGDHGIINVDFEEGIQYVKIDESTLNIRYTKDGKTWTAICTR